MKYVVTDTRTNSLPFGGAQHAACFIDKIRPADRKKITALGAKQRVTVMFCPMATDAGIPVEVYACNEGNEHDAHFNEALRCARKGESIAFEGTKRQHSIIESVLAVVWLRRVA